jgi:uncharacterized protein YecT (DUF1311 family)
MLIDDHPRDCIAGVVEFPKPADDHSNISQRSRALQPGWSEGTPSRPPSVRTGGPAAATNRGKSNLVSTMGSPPMQFRHLLLSLALARIVAGPLPARADAQAAKDAATIGDCLRKQDKEKGSQEAEEAACLMTVAKPCMGDETNASARRRIECLDRERSVWDKIVNDSYKTMVNALEPDQQAKLREMQRSWVHTRDLTCTFWYDYFQGTMANPMIAYCNNRETARRAIFLRIFAADIADRK